MVPSWNLDRGKWTNRRSIRCSSDQRITVLPRNDDAISLLEFCNNTTNKSQHSPRVARDAEKLMEELILNIRVTEHIPYPWLRRWEHAPKSECLISSTRNDCLKKGEKNQELRTNMHQKENIWYHKFTPNGKGNMKRFWTHYLSIRWNCKIKNP